MTADRRAKIENALVEKFSPQSLLVKDQSHLHEGHPGAREGGHFDIRIVSRAFAGKSRLDRHRMVYDTLAPMMKGDIHALKIRALTPDEA